MRREVRTISIETAKIKAFERMYRGIQKSIHVYGRTLEGRQNLRSSAHSLGHSLYHHDVSATSSTPYIHFRQATNPPSPVTKETEINWSSASAFFTIVILTFGYYICPTPRFHIPKSIRTNMETSAHIRIYRNGVSHYSVNGGPW